MIVIDELEQDYEDEVIDLERSYTLDEFLELPFDDDYDYELLIGSRILATSRNPGPNKPHGEAAGRIYNALFNYVTADPARGWAWMETAVKLDKTGRFVKPDVVYLPAAASWLIPTRPGRLRDCRGWWSKSFRRPIPTRLLPIS